MTRRLFVSGCAAAAAVAANGPAQGAARPLYAYVGCFTTAQRYARGDGIHVYRVDRETGAWTHVQHVENLVNPSFLAMGRTCLYSAHGDETYCSAFSVDRESGQLSPLNRVETGGRNGVCVAPDPSGRWVLAANYTSGEVAVLPVGNEGRLGEPAQKLALEGTPGPHRVEQSGPHPHQVLFDPAGKFVVVPDKGLDRIFVFRFDADAGRLIPTAQGGAVARPGSGPRHAAFHPTLPVLWVLNEIASTVTTYFWDAERGHLKPAQILTTLPAEYTAENTSSEIVSGEGGRFVYCTNRGNDSVAIFAADPATGLLQSAGWTPTEGRSPRFMALDPARRFLYVANEQSDTVVSWRVDWAGKLTATGQVVRTASPAAIAWGS
jgi:6-phosphogluconolactonase